MASTKKKYRRTSHGVHLPRKGLAGLVAKVEKSAAPATEVPSFKPGDTVKVHVKIKEGDKERVQAYEGLVIKIGNKGGSKSFIVRKMSHGVGVERIFLFNSPKVAKIDVVQEGKVRRSKLYYIRGLAGKAAKIERDMGAEGAQAPAAK